MKFKVKVQYLHGWAIEEITCDDIKIADGVLKLGTWNGPPKHGMIWDSWIGIPIEQIMRYYVQKIEEPKDSIGE